MGLLRLLPVILSCLLLGAHFYRAGQAALTGLCMALPLPPRPANRATQARRARLQRTSR